MTRPKEPEQPDEAPAAPPLPPGSRVAARFRGLGLKEGDIREFRGEAARPAEFPGLP